MALSIPPVTENGKPLSAVPVGQGGGREGPEGPKALVEAQMSVDFLDPTLKSYESTDKQPLTREYVSTQDWLTGNAEGIVFKEKFSRDDGYDVKKCMCRKWWAKFPGNGDPGKVTVGPCKKTGCPGCGPQRRWLEYLAIRKAFERVTPPGQKLALSSITVSENHVEALTRRIGRDGKVFESIPVGRNQFGLKMYFIITTFFAITSYGGETIKVVGHPDEEIACALARWNESNENGHRSCSKALLPPVEVTDEDEGIGEPSGPKGLVVPVRNIGLTTYRLRERGLLADDKGYVTYTSLGLFDEGFDLILPYIVGKTDRPPEAWHRPDRSMLKATA
jgi:hypothetical protein